MRRAIQAPVFAVAIGAAFSLSGCFVARPPQTSLDLSQIPENIAILVPVEATSLAFPATPSGEESDIVVTIGNQGPYPASQIESEIEDSGGGDVSSPPTASTPFSFKGGTYPGTGGTCGTTIAAEGTCTIVVSFTPTQAGVFSGTAQLTYDDGVAIAPLPLPLAGSSN